MVYLFYLFDITSQYNDISYTIIILIIHNLGIDIYYYHGNQALFVFYLYKLFDIIENKINIIFY